MEFLIQLVVWVLFGYIGFRVAENLNAKYDMNFDPRIWAVVGFIFGIFGLIGMGVYAWFKISKH